jgi:membrane protease subunit (stomatin/prohibitin family)
LLRRSTPPKIDSIEGRNKTMGLLRGVARTAAIAGTATAVSNRVSRRQQNRWAQQEEQQYAPQQQPAPAPAPDPIAQLKDLADLKAQGVLTEAEFEAQKAKVLAS